MTLLQRPLFSVGDHYQILGLIAFADPRRLLSDLNYLIYKHLTAAGIEIPNPQRDLRIRSGRLKVENVTKKDNTG
jgi:small-conductance mechanosensitive channel